MSEHNVTPGDPGVDEDIPAASAHPVDDDLDLPGERLDDDFDVATAREQVWEERRHAQADQPDDPGAVQGS